MVSRTLLTVALVACAHRAANAQVPDTLAILKAVATHEFVTGPSPSRIHPGTWYVRDSVAFRALRELFVARRVAPPQFTDQPPPCGFPLPATPNDTRPGGAVLWYLVNDIAGDSAKVIAFRTCRYADRTFVTGAGYLVRRESAGWKVQRQTGTIIS